MKSYTPSYEITPQTIAILANPDNDGKTTSLVLEENTEYSTIYSPSKVMDYACQYFGSSLRGRQEGTRKISGLTHKVPISIDPSSGMYFFPTASPTNKNCSWIAHTHVNKMMEAPNNATELVFNNGRSVVIDVSIGSMMNQIQRTAQFRFVLDSRVKNMYRNMETDNEKESST